MPYGMAFQARRWLVGRDHERRGPVPGAAASSPGSQVQVHDVLERGRPAHFGLGSPFRMASYDLLLQRCAASHAPAIVSRNCERRGTIDPCVGGPHESWRCPAGSTRPVAVATTRRMQACELTRCAPDRSSATANVRALWHNRTAAWRVTDLSRGRSATSKCIQDRAAASFVEIDRDELRPPHRHFASGLPASGSSAVNWHANRAGWSMSRTTAWLGRTSDRAAIYRSPGPQLPPTPDARSLREHGTPRALHRFAPQGGQLHGRFPYYSPINSTSQLLSLQVSKSKVCYDDSAGHTGWPSMEILATH